MRRLTDYFFRVKLFIDVVLFSSYPEVSLRIHLAYKIVDFTWQVPQLALNVPLGAGRDFKGEVKYFLSFHPLCIENP